MKTFCVYCHTNKINGKQYIGITSQKPEQRWAKGKGYMHNTYMRRAVDKYGWDAFEHEVLYEGLTKEEAEAKEIELIAERNTLNPNGYNAEKGGNLHKEITEETRLRQRNSHLGKTLPLEQRMKIAEAGRGRVFSEETRRKISESNKGRPGSNRGVKFTEEHKRRISESKYKPVLCVETGVIYPSITAAAEAMGVKPQGISAACSHTQHTHRGFHWIRLEDMEEEGINAE